MNKYIEIIAKTLMTAICTISVIGCSLSMLGCSNSNTQLDQFNLIKTTFDTNQTVEIKTTSMSGQFLVKTQDGAIWEIKCNSQSLNCMVIYKNCIFDPIYSVPPKPLSLIQLEK